ncbi:hypothetical protein [Lentilactobacillus parabuchneri]|jgi:hypothetical protein|uniref:hypothetical protein n=2 Tax=Lentilactobacillus parabuchneri TaxID=152331 RepID=UPI000A114913|nr:hypothetical protein [Lentilactobacillus parabuchneri]ORM91160.1 hypothetical protein FAM21809_02226 [Lentilactobacillus parabuchneri]ORN13672.1 hypothetical protein FAM23164_02197 [Lentilactobacillus parabuchneri]ORN15139.1 hypothetical protein FAM23165_02235 [Lentilactobacillus parabuchneri]ORN18407.1 hypothetical protein FAM23166_02239 [Lentilactobacillus parabuchneri]ORN23787.1 hypothetical protein FAM23167_02266 [Lentilactobacillus parabuchneri]
MADIQSIYFAKDVIPDSNEHGTRIILRELRFMVFRQETFFVVVSMINLDYEAEHIITIQFRDSVNNKKIAEIEGQLLIDPEKPDFLKPGFIMVEQISSLPDTIDNSCNVVVSLTESGKFVAKSSTTLLMSREVNPFGE